MPFVLGEQSSTDREFGDLARGPDVNTPNFVRPSYDQRSSPKLARRVARHDSLPGA
jgi:hypothetical protein